MDGTLLLYSRLKECFALDSRTARQVQSRCPSHLITRLLVALANAQTLWHSLYQVTIGEPGFLPEANDRAF